MESTPQTYTLPYDKLVIAVGSFSNTFNIPGVSENAFFLKDISNARAIRARIIECFEKAAQPNTTEKKQIQLLHFAIIGGGPTGIEFGAELHDFIRDDVSRLYPGLINKVQITIYDVAEKILSSFDSELAECTDKE